MPVLMDKTSTEDYSCEFSTPVVSLLNGLPVSELLNKHQTEFEVRPEEDDGFQGGNSAESCFSFDELQRVTNLDLINVDSTEDGEDATPFDRYRRKMENLTDDGKIMKYVLKQGVGSLVPENSLVYIRYQGYIEYQEVPFDSTLWQCNGERDLPMPVNLGKGQLLLGLHKAILSMRKSEKAEFLVHPDWAFGKLGCAPRIPPDATILFVVEIDRFVDCGDIHVARDDLDMYERNQYCNVYKVAKGHYTLGNDFFKQENFTAAVNKYRQVINTLHNARLADETEEKERNHFLIKNYTNACVCYHKLKNYKRVCTMAADAIRVGETEVLQNSKLLYFWGYAKMVLGDYDGAKKHLLAAKKLKPHQQDIANALIDLEKRKTESAQREKIMMQNAFKFQHKDAKVTEYNEDEERFRSKMREQLIKFRDNPTTDVLTLKEQFTTEEENICKGMAIELGLYARVVDGDRRYIHIKKPTAL